MRKNDLKLINGPYVLFFLFLFSCVVGILPF